MGENYLSVAPKSCQECGRLVEADHDSEGGESRAGDDRGDLDWSDFCPSPDCPVKTED